MLPMRKWIVVVLPITFIATFLAIDYLVSSTEHSYLTPKTSSHKLDESSESLGDDSSNHSGENTVYKDTTSEAIREKKVKKTNISVFNSASVPFNEEKKAAVRTSLYSSSEVLSTVSNTHKYPSVLNLPVQKVASSGDKASFILGGPPALFFSMDFINEQVLNHNLQFKNIPVGGLSALSYDLEKDMFIALSDDKAKKGPARFYKMKLINKKVGDSKKYELHLVDQVFLINKEGKRFVSVDPEGVAFFKSDQIFISSEGAQMPELTVSPNLFLFNLSGKWLSTWNLPEMYWPSDPDQIGKWGVKENKAFEALSVDRERNTLWLATEQALHQDDQKNVKSENNKQYVRFSRFDIETQKVNAQFVYPMDADIEMNNLKGKNGLTDFFSLGEQQLIVVERAYLKADTTLSEKKLDANLVRLFLTDCSTAHNVLQHQSLNKGRFVTCGKTLLADLSSVFGDAVDNIEGITIGPEVSTGTYLLVLVSDNNFNPSQKTQFLFFHYSPDEK